MLTTKFLRTFNARLPPDQRYEKDPPSISDILSMLDTDSTDTESASFQAIIRKAQKTDLRLNDITGLLSHLFKKLLQALQTKSQSLQLRITSTLQAYISKTIKTKLPPPIAVPPPVVPSSKPSKPPRRKRQKSDCQGPWCILRKAAGIPWTTTATFSIMRTMSSHTRGCESLYPAPHSTYN